MDRIGFLDRPRTRFCLLLSIAIAQPANAQEEPRTHVLLMLPFASGVGLVGRDEVRSSTTPSTTTVDPDGQVRTTPSFTTSPHQVDRAHATWLGLAIGHDWRRSLRAEIYGAIVDTDERRPRGLIGVRAGPLWSFLEPGNGAAMGAAIRFVAMGGIAYRGQMYEWVHASDWRGQRSLALTVTPAVEVTYYSSPSRGWSVRLKPEFSYVIDQIGAPVWGDPEFGPHWDGYRWGLTGGVEVGATF